MYIDNIRAQFMASPTGEHDEENAIRSKHIEELDRLLIPWVPDDTNTTIKLSSLLQFYGGDERSIPGKYHLQTSLTRLAQLSPIVTSRIPSFKFAIDQSVIRQVPQGL